MTVEDNILLVTECFWFALLPIFNETDICNTPLSSVTSFFR